MTILTALQNAHLTTLIPCAQIRLGEGFLGGVAPVDANSDGYDDVTLFRLNAAGGTTYYGTDDVHERAGLTGTTELLTSWLTCSVSNRADTSPSPATARVTLSVEPTTLDLPTQGRKPIAIDAGYVLAGVPTYERIFTGWVTSVQRDEWPYRVELECEGLMYAATEGAGKHHSRSSIAGDGDLITWLLEIAGLADEFFDIDGDGMPFGTNRPVQLAQGSPPLSLIGDVDRLLVYVTYDSRLGLVVRRQMRFEPSTSEALFTYVDGTPGAGEYAAVIQAFDHSENPKARFNRVVVLGQMPENDGDQRPNTCRVGALGTAYKERTTTIASDLIDVQGVADEICNRQMLLVNRDEQWFSITAPLNPYAEPHLPINLRAVKIPLLQSLKAAVVWGIEHSMTPQKMSTVYRCRYGPTDTGDTEDLTPLASLNLSSSGTGVPDKFIDWDAAGSNGGPGYIDHECDYRLTVNKSPYRSEGRNVNSGQFAVPGAVYLAGITARLRVTNSDGLWTEVTGSLP